MRLAVGYMSVMLRVGPRSRSRDLGATSKERRSPQWHEDQGVTWKGPVEREEQLLSKTEPWKVSAMEG